MSEDLNIQNEDGQQFDLSPEEATSLDGNVDPQSPGLFNRKRVLIVICIAFSVFVSAGLLINVNRSSRNNRAADDDHLAAMNTSAEFLSSLRDRAVNRRDSSQQAPETHEPQQQAEPAPSLPQVSIERAYEVELRSPPPPPPARTQAPPSAPAQSAQQQGPPSHNRAPMVPAVQGSLFSQNMTQNSQNIPASQQGQSVDDFVAARSALLNQLNNQNQQTAQQPFFDSSGTGGAIFEGRFLGENALWPGTIIPGVLETAINTDLPGQVLARVTQNIFDSQTGRTLLIPQGTVLIARYNSSISYAQKRVQIVWDIMIRPDGYQISLDGANAVDRAGMSGQEARYHENWFEYVKAAGIISLFSIANARMTETAVRYATPDTAANIATANAELVNQLGGNLASRAMNIQPTLTVDNGTLINVMTNKTLYLPPVPSFPVTQRYRLD